MDTGTWLAHYGELRWRPGSRHDHRLPAGAPSKPNFPQFFPPDLAFGCQFRDDPSPQTVNVVPDRVDSSVPLQRGTQVPGVSVPTSTPLVFHLWPVPRAIASVIGKSRLNPCPRHR